MQDANELRNALSQLTGTEGYFFNPINHNLEQYAASLKFETE